MSIKKRRKKLSSLFSSVGLFGGSLFVYLVDFFLTAFNCNQISLLPQTFVQMFKIFHLVMYVAVDSFKLIKKTPATQTIATATAAAAAFYE